jgi:hypothetical protein
LLLDFSTADIGDKENSMDTKRIKGLQVITLQQAPLGSRSDSTIIRDGTTLLSHLIF